jgi:hypothetical protein
VLVVVLDIELVDIEAAPDIELVVLARVLVVVLDIEVVLARVPVVVLDIETVPDIGPVVVPGAHADR